MWCVCLYTYIHTHTYICHAYARTHMHTHTQFGDLKNNGALLAKEVLYEIPDQLTSYMRSQNVQVYVCMDVCMYVCMYTLMKHSDQLTI